MKIVFMGSPEFAIPSLEKLLQSEHSVELVVSAPDKERGRGKKLSPTSVKEYAIGKGLEVLTPFSLKDGKFIDRLKEIDADLFIVVAFRILPKEVYAIPKIGSFNLHGSLLPKYRGAAPIQWAVINGEKETGITTFLLADKVDTGNIILQEKIEIQEDDDFGTLHDKLMLLGADAVLKTVEILSKENFQPIKQDDSFASPAPKITKEISRIDWAKPAQQINNLVRGLSPYPCAFYELNGKSYKVFKTRIINKEMEAYGGEWKVGSISTGSQLSTLGFIETKKEIFIQTGNGILEILELQPEGKKRMTTEEFLRGNRLT